MAKLNRKFPVDNAQLEFDDGETPQFKITEAFQTRKEDSLIVKADVLTGDNKGQKHTFFLSYEFKRGGENFNTTQFLKEFYSFDQLLNGDIELDDLLGKVMRAACSISPCGKFTNWQNFENLGKDSWQSSPVNPPESPRSRPASLDDIPF